MNLAEQVELARFTTIGTGGPARWFAEPLTVAELGEALVWARREVDVETIGLGSNVLAHDRGVDALVVRLAGELARVELEGRTATEGGLRRRTRGAAAVLPRGVDRGRRDQCASGSGRSWK